MVRRMGLEPTTTAFAGLCSSIELPPYFSFKMAADKGNDPYLKLSESLIQPLESAAIFS